MNTKTRPTAQPRRLQPAPRRQPTTDPLRREAAERRLYTDFLALAFYPGMRNEAARPSHHAA